MRESGKYKNEILRVEDTPGVSVGKEPPYFALQTDENYERVFHASKICFAVICFRYSFVLL